MDGGHPEFAAFMVTAAETLGGIGLLIGVALLVVAILAAIVTWIALNGSNPIHFTVATG